MKLEKKKLSNELAEKVLLIEPFLGVDAGKTLTLNKETGLYEYSEKWSGQAGSGYDLQVKVTPSVVYDNLNSIFTIPPDKDSKSEDKFLDDLMSELDSVSARMVMDEIKENLRNSEEAFYELLLKKTEFDIVYKTLSDIIEELRCSIETLRNELYGAGEEGDESSDSKEKTQQDEPVQKKKK